LRPDAGKRRGTGHHPRWRNEPTGPPCAVIAPSGTDGLYFTVTVFSTVGLGDIAPVTELARVLVTIQMLVGVLVVGLIAKLVLGAVQLAVVRRGRMPDRIGDEPARQS
jgi:hypothetical protein